MDKGLVSNNLHGAASCPLEVMRAPRTTLLCALIVAACAGESHAAMSGRKPSAGSGQKALLGGPVGGRPTSLTLLEAQSDDALNDPASKPAPRLTARGHGEVKHGSAVNDAAHAGSDHRVYKWRRERRPCSGSTTRSAGRNSR